METQQSTEQVSNPRPRLWKTIVGLACILAFVVTLAGLTNRAAAATPTKSVHTTPVFVMTHAQLEARLQNGTVKVGHGKSITYPNGSQDYAGWYLVWDADAQRWVKGYCVTPRAGLDKGQSFDKVIRVKGKNKPVSQQLMYVLHEVGTPNDNFLSASASQALNTLFGNHAAVNRRAPYLGKRVATKAASLVHDGKNYYGREKLSVTSTQVLIGGHGTVTATLVSQATHRGIPHATITLSAVNASVPTTLTTNKNGIATARFLHTGTGLVKFAASTRVVGGWLFQSNPGYDQQLLLSPGKAVTLHASSTFQKTEAGSSVSYNCDSSCDGRPPVTIHLCHTAGAAESQYQVLANGHVIRTYTLKPRKVSYCENEKFTGQDGLTYTVRRRYHVQNHWTKWQKAGKPIVVDCPPWPIVSAQLSCSCEQGNIELSIPASTHATAINYRVNGGKWQQSVQPAGSSTCPTSTKKDTECVVHIPFNRTKSTTDVVFYGSVQRSNGQWNGGKDSALEIIVPKLTASGATPKVIHRQLGSAA